MRFLPLAAILAALPAAAADVYEASVKPLVRTYCVGCHNAKQAPGGFDAEILKADQRPRWTRIAARLRAGEMPPKGAPRPPAELVRAAIEWVEATAPEQPASAIRRLNRVEYGASVRDLFGVDLDAGAEFPPDPYSYGFDNIAAALSLSPVLGEKYLKSAERISRAVVPVDGEIVKPAMERYLAERMNQDERLHLFVDHVFPADGEYTLRSAWYQALRDGLRLRLRLFLDGKEVANGVLSFYYQMDRGLEARNIRIPAGRHRVEADIEVLSEREYRGRPPYLEYIQISGPSKLTPAVETAPYKRLFVCGHAPGHHEAGCARRVLEPVARKAWRAPVSGSALDDILSIASKAQTRSGSFEQGIRAGLQAILVSPKFLFRAEPGPDHALASRLSYFLWSSLPDEELSRVADGGRLRDPAVFAAQVKRMLADPKSRALAENFAGQWLQTRNLASHRPDRERFPEFDAGLREAMRTETEMFFDAVLREDRSILDFLDARFTFVNERLAKHYGIAGVTGPAFRRVELDGARRGGVLGHASVLTVSSYPTRTSPVIRGKWVLENLLNAPPPPPPDDVPALNEQAIGSAESMRRQLEKHRSNPVCASCHARMDPLGFGLENYDAIGRWRDADGKFPVDAAGVLPDGRSFAGPAELRRVLLEDKSAFTRALAEKMLTYAVGRGLAGADRAALDGIVRRVEREQYRLQALVQAVIGSEPFQPAPAGVKSGQ